MIKYQADIVTKYTSPDFEIRVEENKYESWKNGYEPLNVE